MNSQQARLDYGALLEEARALLELGREADGLRPRVRELVSELNGAQAGARLLAEELAEVHRRAYHLETCLAGGAPGALPEPFQPEVRGESPRSRPSGLSG